MDYNAQNPFDDEQPQAQRYDPQKLITELNTPIELTPEGLDRKEAELRLREEDIARREGMLLDKEKTLPKARPPNWPRCKPFIHHDIVDDMPTPETVALIKRAYGGWFAYIFCLFWNLVTLAGGMIATGSGDYISSFFIALALTIVTVPISFLNYRLLYNAARKTKSSLYFIWFILMGFSFVTWIWYAIGLKSWGGGGFFIMLSLFKKKKTLVIAVFALLCFTFWVTLIGYHIYLIIIARFEYRKAGGYEKAKKEVKDKASEQMENQKETTA